MLRSDDETVLDRTVDNPHPRALECEFRSLTVILKESPSIFLHFRMAQAPPTVYLLHSTHY